MLQGANLAASAADAALSSCPFSSRWCSPHIWGIATKWVCLKIGCPKSWCFLSIFPLHGHSWEKNPPWSTHLGTPLRTFRHLLKVLNHQLQRWPLGKEELEPIIGKLLQDRGLRCWDDKEPVTHKTKDVKRCFITTKCLGGYFEITCPRKNVIEQNLLLEKIFFHEPNLSLLF